MTIGLPLTIPNSFARTARWFGNGEAVVDSMTRLTYAELDLLSRRAAALFGSLGAALFGAAGPAPGGAACTALPAERDLSRCLAGRCSFGCAADGAAHPRI